jgi:hypothetical protein
MMRGDFSRLTFDPRDNYSQVLLQQGRVLLDADFNEQTALSAYRLRQLARDVFGPHAGPVDSAGHPGFFITKVDDTTISAEAGRYYVDGLGVENPSAVSFVLGRNLNLENNMLNLLYLDVWERHVTWLEKDTLSEPALGGPDTSTRAQLAWQVRGISLRGVDISGNVDWMDWLNNNVRRWPRATNPNAALILPQLQAWTDPQASEDDVPCVADPAGGYRGLENQLYRVEIHTAGSPGGTAKPTFKWSRENGSGAAPWLDTEGTDLLVEGIHDSARGFAAGQWVELTSLDRENEGVTGVMVQLVKVDGLRLTMDPNSASDSIPDPKTLDHPVVRRWDHREARNDRSGFKGGAIVLDESRDFYLLEAGIKIAFPPLAGNANGETVYRPGDYWLIPARPAIGDILWPQDQSKTGQARYLPLEPAGVEHVYAPLMLIDMIAGALTLSGNSLQKKYQPPISGF